MDTIQTSGRADAQSVLSTAVARLPRMGTLETVNGRTRASFRPSGDPAPAPATPAVRVHPPLTLDRVVQLTVIFAGQELRRGDKTRHGALRAAGERVHGIIGENAAVSEEERHALVQKLFETCIDPVAFWAMYDASNPPTPPKSSPPIVKPVPVVAKAVVRPAAPVAEAAKPAVRSARGLSSEALLAALTGASQMTDDPEPIRAPAAKQKFLAIPDEEDDAGPELATSSAQPAAATQPARPRQPARQPFTTAGYAASLVTHFSTCFTLDGLDPVTAQKKAVGRVRHFIEQDSSLKSDDQRKLVREVMALLPPPPPPPMVTMDDVATLDGSRALLWDAELLVKTIRDDSRIATSDKGRLLDAIQGKVQTHFTKPIIARGGSSLQEIEEAVAEAAAWLDRLLTPREPRRNRPARPDGQRVPQPRTFSPTLGDVLTPREQNAKVTETVELSPAEQARRADAKKTVRLARTELSSNASRKLTGDMIQSKPKPKPAKGEGGKNKGKGKSGDKQASSRA